MQRYKIKSVKCGNDDFIKPNIEQFFIYERDLKKSVITLSRLDTLIRFDAQDASWASIQSDVPLHQSLQENVPRA
jgi:hypothetical protein